jgi:hypothetical protein
LLADMAGAAGRRRHHSFRVRSPQSRATWHALPSVRRDAAVALPLPAIPRLGATQRALASRALPQSFSITTRRMPTCQSPLPFVIFFAWAPRAVLLAGVAGADSRRHQLFHVCPPQSGATGHALPVDSTTQQELLSLASPLPWYVAACAGTAGAAAALLWRDTAGAAAALLWRPSLPSPSTRRSFCWLFRSLARHLSDCAGGATWTLGQGKACGWLRAPLSAASHSGRGYLLCSPSVSLALLPRGCARSAACAVARDRRGAVCPRLPPPGPLVPDGPTPLPLPLDPGLLSCSLTSGRRLRAR